MENAEKIENKVTETLAKELEAKKNGTKIGLTKGTTLITAKSIKCKEIIKKHATDFGGTLNDKDVITLCKISRNSYYKYKKQLKSNPFN